MNWTTADGELYSGYKEKGYFPQSFINMLAFGLESRNIPGDFSLEELVESFTLKRVSKSGAKFDPDKTRWFQQQYLRNESNEVLASLLESEIPNSIEKEKLLAIVSLMKERATFVVDVLSEGAYLLAAPSDFDAKLIAKKWKENTTEIMLRVEMKFPR